MLEKQLYLRLVSNLIIPVLGFLVWDWNLYFILLFFSLDILSDEITTYLKVRKVQQIQQEVPIHTPTKTMGFISLALVILIIGAIISGMKLYQPHIESQEAILSFLFYKEMGIPQIYVLLPLIGLMTYANYKNDFIRTQLYRIQSEKIIWKEHITKLFLLFSLSIILLLIATSYQLTEWIVLTIILVIITAYNYLQGKEQIRIIRQGHY